MNPVARSLPYTPRLAMSWDDAKRMFHELQPYFYFRGQPRMDWPLQTSLERQVPPSTRLIAEMQLRTGFKNRAHQYLSYGQTPQTELGWLALMQHHGVP